MIHRKLPEEHEQISHSSDHVVDPGPMFQESFGTLAEATLLELLIVNDDGTALSDLLSQVTEEFWSRIIPAFDEKRVVLWFSVYSRKEVK